jgi:tight adherence protein B
MLMLAVAMLILAFGGAAFAIAVGSNESSQKRIASVAKAPPRAARATAESQGQRRKSMQQLLKEIEKKQAENKPTMTLRRRLDRAGFAEAPTRNFWIASGLVAFLAAALCLFGAHMSLLASVGAAFGAGFGLPRWVLNFLRARREKRFTNDFAGAIDVVVRSVKSGLPTGDALRIVASEFRDPVGGEFKRLVESMKVGVTLEQALKRMFENMPTTEVSFFAIVMTIQQKSGGNLSEALGNLAAVLRDRKRLQGKIKAMSSEAKASAIIIGSLPPGVIALVYFTTPAYMTLLFTERVGNLMLVGCVLWMSLGIFVMKKMINFKH